VMYSLVDRRRDTVEDDEGLNEQVFRANPRTVQG